VAIPADRNVVQKGAEEKLKYRSLGIEIKRMCKLKCTTISVINGAWKSNEKLKETFGSYTKEIFDRFTTKDSYT
jgi:hypothetical protein